MDKLRQLVLSMNRFDQKAFEEYLLSPYHNRRKDLVKLFHKLKTEPHKGLSLNSDALSRSELTRLLENFFADRYTAKQPYAVPLAKLQSLAERDCEKSWHYTYHELFRDTPYRDAEYHLAAFKAGEHAISYLAGKQSRKREMEYDELFRNLDAYYLSKKLQLACEVVNRQSLMTKGAEPTFIRPLLIQAQPLSGIPAVRMYGHILLMLIEPADETHFRNARKEVDESGNLFPHSELAACIVYLKNYCIRKMNSGNTVYAQILFDIYTSYLSSQKLIRIGYLSQFEFKNIVSLALRLKQYDWCRNFIRKYSYHLHPGEKRNAVTYNTAYLHFMTGNFRLAIRMLREVEFTDVVYQLDARVILLKCYYELNDMDAFFYHASAFRLFLLRNRYISDFQKKLNRNLIRYLTRMVRDQYSAVKVTRLKAEIAMVTDVADVKWLQEKVEEL